MKRKPSGTKPSKLPRRRNFTRMVASCRIRRRVLKRWTFSKKSRNVFGREFMEVWLKPASSLQQAISLEQPPTQSRHKPRLQPTRRSRASRRWLPSSTRSRISTNSAGLSRTGTIASMRRSSKSARLGVVHHSIARSAVRDCRYRTRSWAAAIAVAILAVAGMANSADMPPLWAQEQMDASEIQLALQKLNVLGRVLYIAAHPDDENTNLMAF